MNLSIAKSRAVLTVLEGGRARAKHKAEAPQESALAETIHCTEQAWRSSWHERMENEEQAYDDVAFGTGERGAC